MTHAMLKLKPVLLLTPISNNKFFHFTTAHPWYNDHSTSISDYGVWEVRVKIQVSLIP